MKLASRRIFVLALVLVLLPVRAVAVHAAAPDPVQIASVDPLCAGLAMPGGVALSGEALSGSQYCITVPPVASPLLLQGVVIFAHGYVFDYPPGLPPVIPYHQLGLFDPATQTETSIPALVNGMGFVFATTSYSQNGLAVKQGVDEVAELVGVVQTAFQALYGFPAPPFPVFLIGASEGGLVTTLAIEKYPQIFSGGVATCGPVGDFRRQVDYWGDFRVLFGEYFHKVDLGKDPMQVPAEVMANWGSFSAPGPLMLETAALVQKDLDKQGEDVQRLLTASQAPIDPLAPESILSTILGILDYNVMATNQAVAELGGIPFSNLDRVYTPFPADPSINARVTRVAAEAAALAEIEAFYQTSGELQRPLVLMHTKLDPIVPAWHMPLYAAKAAQQGSSGLLATILIDRYGHCQFTTSEAVNAFTTMLQMAAMQGALPNQQGQ